MASDTMDSTKGLTSPTVRPTSSVLTTNTPEHPFSNTQDTAADSPLELFQWLVGIHTPLCLKHTLDPDKQSDNTSRYQRFIHTIFFLKHPSHHLPQSENVGLYTRAREQERSIRIKYVLTSYISNTLFLLQIMLAAAFTGLSAYKEASAVTLTVLGAINTVVAGCLAWQKGQGVPQRYRKAQDQYQALILEIEMAERAFIDVETGRSPKDEKLDPRKENARLQKLYETAKADQQANYPDLYVSSKDMARQVEDTKAEAAKVQAELMARIDGLVKTLEAKVGEPVVQKLEAKVGEHIESAVVDVPKK